MDESGWGFEFLVLVSGKVSVECCDAKAVRSYAFGHSAEPLEASLEAEIVARTAPLPRRVQVGLRGSGKLPSAFAPWFFAQWLREAAPRDTEELDPAAVASELLDYWDQFTRRYPVFRRLAPTALGLTRGGPSCGPTGASSVPGAALEEVTHTDHDQTAWYEADPWQIAGILGHFDRHPLDIHELTLVTDADLERWILDRWDAFAPRWFLTWRSSRRAFADPSVMACVVPRVPLGPSLPCVFTQQSPVLEACLLANLNTLCLDHLVLERLRGANVTVKRFQELPLLPPDAYGADDQQFIVPRVVELSFTTPDLALWAELVLRQAGLPASGPFFWDIDRRALLKAELNVRFVRLYRLDAARFRRYLEAGIPDTVVDIQEDPVQRLDDPVLERLLTLRLPV